MLKCIVVTGDKVITSIILSRIGNNINQDRKKIGIGKATVFRNVYICKAEAVEAGRCRFKSQSPPHTN